MTRPVLEGEDVLDGLSLEDEPEKFVWFVGGWGPRREKYIANAVRTIRPLLCVDRWSTLDMRFSDPDSFKEEVESQNAEGYFPWGDFPYGGAVDVQMGPLFLTGAVSCLTEIENDQAARFILGGFGKLIVLGNNLLSDARSPL